MDFRTKSDIESSIKRLNEIFHSKILWQNPEIIYKNSVLIEALILLKDLTKKSEKYFDNRINFTDDIIKNKFVNDITDLIGLFRDCMCHVDSFKKIVDEVENIKGMTISFCEIQGKGNLININGFILGSKYDDDIAFIMGGNVLYLKRHIERVYLELTKVFS